MAVARPTPHDDEPVEEITSLDDLRRIAADVQHDNRPRLVSIPGGGNITLAPARKKRRKLTPEERAKADEDAFLSSAGGWKGFIDPDEFMKQVRAGRSSRRPPVVFPPDDETGEPDR
jgi:hypothetical protein